MSWIGWMPWVSGAALGVWCLVQAWLQDRATDELRRRLDEVRP